MKLTIATLTALLLAIGTQGAASAQWDQHYTNCHNWEFEVGTRLLVREPSDLGFQLVTDNVTNQVLMTDRDFSRLDTSAGIDIRASKLNQGFFDWETRWFYQTWDGQASATGTGNLQTPFLPGFTPSSVATNYDSDIFSVELNAKRAIAPGLTFLIGPRFTYLREVQSVNSNVPVVVLGIPLNVPFTTTTETQNPLVGLQIGTEYKSPVPVVHNMWVSGFVKAGVYGNNAQSTITNSAGGVGGITLPGFSGEKAVASFIGEIGGKIYYEIIPGSMAAYASYEATWLDGVAMAPAQLGTFGTNTVHSSSTPFYHGLGLGFLITR